MTSALPQEKRSGYLPTLDGWRAIAIVAVIFHHSRLLSIGPFNTRWLYDFGDSGVPVFFAISGLLICSRLLEEEARTGSLHLRGFYIRRVLRIQPASLVFLAVILVLKLLGRIPLSNQGFLAALFLVRNYFPWHATGATDFATLHFWSLSVEEHFYLLLPAFLLLVRQKRARYLLAFTAVIVLWSNYAAHHGLLAVQAYHRTDLILSQLVLPSAIAVLLRKGTVRKTLARFLLPSVAIALTLVICLPTWLHMQHAFHSPMLIVPSLLVTSTLLHSSSFFGRFLEWAPLRFIGRISYGLYLWQEFLFTGHFAPALRPFGAAGDFPWNLILVVALATASYYLVERPCMRLGHRIAKPSVEGRPELATANP